MQMLIINRPRILPIFTAYRIAKRIMDVALALAILPVALPIGLLCTLAILLESGWPVLFVQDRVGHGGRIFKILKFRTMWPNLDTSEHQAFMSAFVKGQLAERANGRDVYKPFQAGQVTRVGRLLRKTSLDELPQLINVLKGEMSIIGPRPNVPWEVAEYRQWHHERLEVLPGITGLAQVRGRSGLNFETIVKHDVEYVRNASIGLDIKILYWTVRSIFAGEGAL